MRAGMLRHQIVIQETSSIADSLGTKVKSWVTFATVNAEKDPQRGREFFAEHKVQDVLSTVWRIRYLAGVTAKMRVAFNGEFFDIVSPPVDVKGRTREMFLLTVSGVKDGR